MAEENPTDPVLVPDEGSPEEIQTVNDGGPDPGEKSHDNALSGSPIDDTACTSANVETDSTARMLLALMKMFEVAKWYSLLLLIFLAILVCLSHGLLLSPSMSGEEELRSRLEQAEASLSAARRAFEESSPDRASRGKEMGGSYRSSPARGGGRDGPAEGGGETTPDRGVN
ncbi:hypothetical protein AAG906_011164 [Vitis piasezkii]